MGSFLPVFHSSFQRHTFYVISSSENTSVHRYNDRICLQLAYTCTEASLHKDSQIMPDNSVNPNCLAFSYLLFLAYSSPPKPKVLGELYDLTSCINNGHL